MKKAFVIAAVVALSLTGCRFIRLQDAETWEKSIVRGNGNMVTRTMDLGAFDEVSLTFSGNVIYNEVSDTHCVTVTAPENIFEYLDFTVEKGELKLRFKKGVSVNLTHGDDIIVNLAAPTLRNVAIAGSGDFRAEVPIVAGSFNGAIAGSGDMSLADVTAGDVKLVVTGSGDLRARNLKCDELAAVLVGSGDMLLGGRAGKADLSVSGSGDMDIRTLTADELNTSVAGSGDIRK